LYRDAIGWLKVALKKYNEYYDLHLVSLIEILEELAISFFEDNQETQGRNVVNEIMRIDSNNKIAKYLVQTKAWNIKLKEKTKNNLTHDLCYSPQIISFLTLTCPM
jgi:hypothetical protein